MFSKFQLAKKYVRYLLRASNKKGHRTHSPFVFDFITKVLNNNKKYPFYLSIESIRSLLKKDNTYLEIEEFGAGSRKNATNKRKISAIAQSALKPKKYSQLLFKIVQHYQPFCMVELGTCFGITTAYLANGNCKAEVITMEGAKQIAAIAEKNFEKLSIKNIELIEGNFDNTLPNLITHFRQEQKKIDFVFIDGNHREEPTIRYFQQLMPLLHESSIVVFDDIHWSREMENAWHEIINHQSVTLSIDLFFIGIVFFRKEQKTKQHFTIRY